MKRKLLAREGVTIETEEGYVLIRQENTDRPAAGDHVVRLEPEDIPRVIPMLQEAAKEVTPLE